MKRNKRGMSQIVTTLIIILLSIVALGVVWVVIRNVVEGGKSQIELGSKCREVDLTVKRIIVSDIEGDGAWDDYSVKLSRKGGGEDAVRIKFLLSDGKDQYSDVLEFGVDFNPLETKTNASVNNITVANATEIEITPYFLNADTNEEEICSNTFTETFTAVVG